MEQITTREEVAAHVGQKVHLVEGAKTFSGTLLGFKHNYAYVVDGTMFKSIYVSSDGLRGISMYVGEYDSKVIGYEIIKYYERRIESIRKVYMDQ